MDWLGVSPTYLTILDQRATQNRVVNIWNSIGNDELWKLGNISWTNLSQPASMVRPADVDDEPSPASLRPTWTLPWVNPTGPLIGASAVGMAVKRTSKVSVPRTPRVMAPWRNPRGWVRLMEKPARFEHFGYRFWGKTQKKKNENEATQKQSRIGITPEYTLISRKWSLCFWNYLIISWVGMFMIPWMVVFGWYCTVRPFTMRNCKQISHTWDWTNMTKSTQHDSWLI